MDPQWIRIADAALAGTALLLLIVRVGIRWRFFNPTARLLLLSLGALLFIGCGGSIEAMAQNAPLGLRSYMAGAAYMWIIIATTVAFHEPERP